MGPVLVKHPIYLGLSRQSRVYPGTTQEIKSLCALWEDAARQTHGKTEV